ncbi:MAG TPA: hypothetical protein DGG95_11310 [Cytophagales bacterium]|jgi:hypothetical protein|nr:hypothetical protein [Cytophagales bacterium]
MNLRGTFRLFCLCLALIFICGFRSLAQLQTDTLIHWVNSFPVEFYKKSLGTSTRLFNGREYKAYHSAKDENPYLFLDWTKADLEYEGQWYNSVPIMVDISNNGVIINYMGGFLQLVKEKLSQFVIKGRKFIFLQPAGLSPGFYELLYEGQLKIYSHRQKKYKEKLTGMEIVREFEDQERFYVMIENQMHVIKNRKDFLALFPAQMLVLKTEARKKGLRFKKNLRTDLIALSIFCDQLNVAR